MTPILVILASWPHLTHPCCPDAGTSEGTRLGEGSREFVLEGHRVSCLVPTSDGSGRGVNFGNFGVNFSLSSNSPFSATNSWVIMAGPYLWLRVELGPAIKGA